MRRVLVLCFSVLLGLGVACGGDGDGGGSGSETEGPAGFANEKVNFVRVQCTCEGGGGAIVPENNACVRRNLGTSSACEEEVLEERWDELERGGDCMREAYLESRECLLENCDIEGCYGVLQSATERCPANVKEAFAECTG
jgi:hypothetical protein